MKLTIPLTVALLLCALTISPTLGLGEIIDTTPQIIEFEPTNYWVLVPEPRPQHFHAVRRTAKFIKRELFVLWDLTTSLGDLAI